MLSFIKRNLTNILLSILILLFLLQFAGGMTYYYFSRSVAFGGAASHSSIGYRGSPATASEQYYYETSYSGSRVKVTSVDMDIEVGYGKLNRTVSQINEKARMLGGYSLDENYYNYNYYSTASIEFRIPHNNSAAFESFISSNYHLKSKRKSARDITESYYSKKAEIKRLEEYKARLENMSARTKDISDMIKIESELKNVNYELDNAYRQMKDYENSISYDRYYIQVSEKPQPWKHVFASVSDLLKLFLKAINAGIVVIVAILGFSIPFLPLIGIWRWVKRPRKRKK